MISNVLQPRSQSADSTCRTPTDKAPFRQVQDKIEPKSERVKGRARERLPFSDTKDSNKENFLVPETPGIRNKTPRPRPTNKNLIEQTNYDYRKPRSPLMAKQLPVALDDTCKHLTAQRELAISKKHLDQDLKGVHLWATLCPVVFSHISNLQGLQIYVQIFSVT